MSSGTPNLRVGLEVKIFGGNQIKKAQAALSALGLTIDDVEDALVNVSIEKSHDKRIIGSAIIRSKVKEFTIILGDKIKTLVK